MKLTPDSNNFKFTTETIAFPLYFVLFMWVVFWFETTFHYNFVKYGLYPKSLTGLRGILFAPFLHSDLKHLFSNSVPLFVLLLLLMYFYRKIAYKILIIGTIILGLLTWLIGRENYHIGASGIVYLLFSFIFFSGLIRKYYRLTAVSLMVIFLYGGMVWFLFPVDEKISWEGHLSGFIVGLILAVWYRKIGPEPFQYEWEKPNYKKDAFDLQFDDNGNFILPKSEEEKYELAQKLKINYHYIPNKEVKKTTFATSITTMNKIQQNISLKPYNTFGLDVPAKEFIQINSMQALKQILAYNKDVFVLGGGSNMLLTKPIESLVVKLDVKGKRILSEDENQVIVEVFAGENWHNFVLWAIENDYGGIENLSLIPGNVGACPIQNIGAYGVEVKDVILRVHVLERATLQEKIIPNPQCNFGYRTSIFKTSEKDKYIITSVVFKLTKKNHQIKASYGTIQQELKNNKINEPTIKDISNAVVKIRSEKLPNPTEIGNSGSFFKNPVVEKDIFIKIQTEYPNMPFYAVNDKYKIPAGWLIEQCGFKGKRFGDAGVHKNQALVLVNYGNATGKEILQLSEQIKSCIKNTFNINLETEVNIF